MEPLSIHSARSLAPRNAQPAPEYPRAAPATEATPAETHKSGETGPDGISPRARELPDRDASPLPPAHPHSPAYPRLCAPLLLLPAPAAAWPAWPEACLQSHPKRSCRDPPARTSQCDALLLR